MSRKPIIAGNWKMNLNYLEAIKCLQELNDYLTDANFDFSKEAVVVVPSFTNLRSVQVFLESENSKIAWGSQDISAHEDGAYTGEVSGTMLKPLGVSYVLIGHSERRQYHVDKDPKILIAKISKTIECGFTPIFCCGEGLEVRKENKQIEFVSEQLNSVLKHFSAEDIEKMVIAYEPIWAIGTGETATDEDAQEVCGAIRKWVAQQFSTELADAVRIQYGGSVKSTNASSLMAKPDIDGLLVGGASLKADEFSKIVMF